MVNFSNAKRKRRIVVVSKRNSTSNSNDVQMSPAGSAKGSADIHVNANVRTGSLSQVGGATSAENVVVHMDVGTRSTDVTWDERSEDTRAFVRYDDTMASAVAAAEAGEWEKATSTFEVALMQLRHVVPIQLLREYKKKEKVETKIEVEEDEEEEEGQHQQQQQQLQQQQQRQQQHTSTYSERENEKEQQQHIFAIDTSTNLSDLKGAEEVALGGNDNHISITSIKSFEMCRILEMQAQCLLELGHVHEAVKKATRATQHYSASPHAWLTLGRVQLGLGEVRLAAPNIQKAIDRFIVDSRGRDSNGSIEDAYIEGLDGARNARQNGSGCENIRSIIDVDSEELDGARADLAFALEQIEMLGEVIERVNVVES